MKADLNRLMADRGLAAIIVAIDENYSVALDYLVGNVHITNGLAIKPIDADPVLLVNPMEIEEAAASGHKVYTFNDMGWQQMLKDAEGDRTQAEVVFWGTCLKNLGVESGKVGIYGTSELNLIIELVRLLEKAYPEYQFVGEIGSNIFDQAAVTKEDDELERLRSVSHHTSEVLQATWNYISQNRAEGQTVIKADGTSLTIGDVKRFVRRELLERELEDTGMIFAQGRDGAFPHSRGKDDEALELGKPIVFDLFPREMGGGYHHDTTRTWCIGYAPDDVQALYNTVMDAFDIAVETYNIAKPSDTLQHAVCDYFESKGHPTSRSNPGTMEGYVHSLGHGIGLKIHESPRMTHMGKPDTFQVGNVITIEPGLYYPEKGMGARVEDSFYIAPDGSLIALTDFHKELVIPLAGGA